MAEGGEIRSNALTDYYQYNGNNVEFCVEIVKQEAADGQGEAADYMVIFAKKHDGEEGGEIWTPPAL